MSREDERPTHIDGCSGFGGFALAAQWAGFGTIGFAEIADYPSRLLGERFPGVPNWGDLRNTPPVHCELFTCGDPCQPFSVAGRKQGETDDRYLWPAVLDAIGRHNPDWCVLENVTAIGNMVLSRRIDDLASRGYQSKAFDIPSCAVGLPTMERHIWLVAARDGVKLDRHTAASVSRSAVLAVRDSYSSGHAWKLFGPDLSQPILFRSRKGFPNFVERITGIGNAVPPPVAYQILRTIRDMYDK
jgi:DNA (cytosine-5)-methyltransferase 1